MRGVFSPQFFADPNIRDAQSLAAPKRQGEGSLSESRVPAREWGSVAGSSWFAGQDQRSRGRGEHSPLHTRGRDAVGGGAVKRDGARRLSESQGMASVRRSGRREAPLAAEPLGATRAWARRARGGVRPAVGAGGRPREDRTSPAGAQQERCAGFSMRPAAWTCIGETPTEHTIIKMCFVGGMNPHRSRRRRRSTRSLSGSGRRSTGSFVRRRTRAEAWVAETARRAGRRRAGRLVRSGRNRAGTGQGGPNRLMDIHILNAR